MAKSRTRPSTRSKAKPEKAEPKRAKPRTEVEVVDENAGPGWETGVAILTGVLIFVAILIVDFGLGKNYDAGIFF